MSLHSKNLQQQPTRSSARVSDPAETLDRRSPGDRGRPAPNGRAGLRGFTLMEMLIVIAIMLLLVIATLPRLKQSMDESKVREASRQLSSHFSRAKARAAATGRPCGLWFVTEQIGPATPPGTFQTTELYLAEIPPPYSGDVQEARVVVTDSSGNQAPTWTNFNNINPPGWLLNFPPASNAGLFTLIPQTAPNNTFFIRFDHKGPLFPGIRIGNLFYVTGGPTLPPHGNGLYDANTNPSAGYQYEIIRLPQRIGAPLALPRGTSVDLTYSGFGNSGTDFYSSPNQILVLFTPDGRVGNVTYQTWNATNSNYPIISNDAAGTLHFLVGRPEKVGLPLNQSNLNDNNALWVSVGRLTGSVTTTENAPNIDFVFSNPATAAEQQAYLTIAREYAITQDVKGGH